MECLIFSCSLKWPNKRRLSNCTLNCNRTKIFEFIKLLTINVYLTPNILIVFIDFIKHNDLILIYFNAKYRLY